MQRCREHLLIIFKSSKWSEPTTSTAPGRGRLECLGEGVRVPRRGDIRNTWEVWGREQEKGMVRKKWIIAWGWGRVGGLRMTGFELGVRIFGVVMGRMQLGSDWVGGWSRCYAGVGVEVGVGVGVGVRVGVGVGVAGYGLWVRVRFSVMVIIRSWG